MQKRIVIIGSNFAGYTAAMKLQEELKGEHAITVISKSPDFLFMPSLIWVPFGLREREQITIPLEPLYEKKGIRFVLETVDRIDLAQRTVHTEKGFYGYDYLVIATGPELAYDAIPGLGPINGYTQSIFSWEHAERTQQAFEELVRIAFEEMTVFERAGFAFVDIDRHEARRRVVVHDAPFAPGRKAGTAEAAQVGVLECDERRFTGCFTTVHEAQQLRVAARSTVGREVDGVAGCVIDVVACRHGVEHFACRRARHRECADHADRCLRAATDTGHTLYAYTVAKCFVQRRQQVFGAGHGA